MVEGTELVMEVEIPALQSAIQFTKVCDSNQPTFDSRGRL